jgi:hypothetical protein
MAQWGRGTDYGDDAIQLDATIVAVGSGPSHRLMIFPSRNAPEPAMGERGIDEDVAGIGGRSFPKTDDCFLL